MAYEASSVHAHLHQVVRVRPLTDASDCQFEPRMCVSRQIRHINKTPCIKHGWVYTETEVLKTGKCTYTGCSEHPNHYQRCAYIRIGRTCPHSIVHKIRWDFIWPDRYDEQCVRCSKGGHRVKLATARLLLRDPDSSGSHLASV
ncbi:hypothetical protein ABKN59_006651 [Abortiporus biennis]